MNKPTWCCLRDLFQFYHRGEINYKFDGTVTCGTSSLQKNFDSNGTGLEFNQCLTHACMFDNYSIIYNEKPYRKMEYEARLSLFRLPILQVNHTSVKSP